MLRKLGKATNGYYVFGANRQYRNLECCPNCGERQIDWSDGDLSSYRELTPVASMMFSSYDCGIRKFYQLPTAFREKHSDKSVNVLFPADVSRADDDAGNRISRLLLERYHRENYVLFQELNLRRVFFCQQCGSYIVSTRIEYSERSDYNRNGLEFGSNSILIKADRCSELSAENTYSFLVDKPVYAIVDKVPLSKMPYDFELEGDDALFAIYDNKLDKWDFSDMVTERLSNYYATKTTICGNNNPVVIPGEKTIAAHIVYKDSPAIKMVEIPRSTANHIHRVKLMGELQPGRVVSPHEFDLLLKYSNYDEATELS